MKTDCGCVIPYAVDAGGHFYFLVGDETDDGRWSAFAGGAEPEDEGDIAATAAREFAEETCGIFPPIHGTLATIRPTVSATPRGRRITTWFVKFDGVDPSVAHRFHAARKGTTDVHRREKRSLRYVEANHLLGGAFRVNSAFRRDVVGFLRAKDYKMVERATPCAIVE